MNFYEIYLFKNQIKEKSCTNREYRDNRDNPKVCEQRKLPKTTDDKEK